MQNPADAGTLQMPVSLRTELGRDAGFDIAGSDNVGYVAGTRVRDDDAQVYAVDLATGETRRVGRLGRGDVTVTGLAAWQDAALDGTRDAAAVAAPPPGRASRFTL